GVWANNALSDPVSSVLYMLGDATTLVPDLAPGVSVASILRRSVDYWIDFKSSPMAWSPTPLEAKIKTSWTAIRQSSSAPGVTSKPQATRSGLGTASNGSSFFPTTWKSATWTATV